MGTKTIKGESFYKERYHSGNIPLKAKYKSELRTIKFKGTSSCGKVSRARRNALKELKNYENLLKEQIPSAIIVKSGWKSGKHYNNTNGGGFGSSGRSCKGYVQCVFHITYILP
jgi:hypothetical protein